MSGGSELAQFGAGVLRYDLGCDSAKLVRPIKEPRIYSASRKSLTDSRVRKMDATS